MEMFAHILDEELAGGMVFSISTGGVAERKQTKEGHSLHNFLSRVLYKPCIEVYTTSNNSHRDVTGVEGEEHYVTGIQEYVFIFLYSFFGFFPDRYRGVG